MKLEEGMYVRTKYGIARFIRNLVTKATIYRVIDKKIVYDNVKHWEDCLLDNEIIKASHNIIDLIEVGDYLNGFKVSKIERYDTKTIIKIGNSTFNVLEGEEIYTPSYDNNNGYEKLEKLKSIVTKEQFESMKYEVK